jgi:hypothetical protein
MSASTFSTNSFSDSLRIYREEDEQRVALLRKAFAAGIIAGNYDVAPDSFMPDRYFGRSTAWKSVVAREYYNVADFYGWPELPGYKPLPPQTWANLMGYGE